MGRICVIPKGSGMSVDVVDVVVSSLPRNFWFLFGYADGRVVEGSTNHTLKLEPKPKRFGSSGGSLAMRAQKEATSKEALQLCSYLTTFQSS